MTTADEKNYRERYYNCKYSLSKKILNDDDQEGEEEMRIMLLLSLISLKQISELF